MGASFRQFDEERRRLVLELGSYSGCCCHVTSSNSLPSGSANVVWRTAATPGGRALGGSLISWSGLAPRPVSRSISSSWWSVTRTGWMLFLAVWGSGGWWRIIRGPLSGLVASTAVSPATAPGLTGRPRALPQKSARVAGSAESMVRAAKLRLTVVVMAASFRWGFIHGRPPDQTCWFLGSSPRAAGSWLWLS